MDWHNARVFCASWRMNPRNFGDSWTFLDLHHDEFVVHGDLSTCWMDNHAYWVLCKFGFGEQWLTLRFLPIQDFSPASFLKWTSLLDGILLNFWSVDFGHFSTLSMSVNLRRNQRISGLMGSVELAKGLAVVSLFHFSFPRAFGCTQLHSHIWSLLCRLLRVNR